MGKSRTRAVEKGVVGQSRSGVLSGSLNNIPSGPVYYPTEDEFKDPLEFIYKVRPEAEPYGICRIVPPKNWKPPFALDLDSFSFPTKTQAIHQLQARPAACDSKTFELEYNRFLEKTRGKKAKKRVAFEGDDLDFCRLFNAVKRYGGYDEVVKRKKWGEVAKILKSGRKVSDCRKHVLSLLYLEHLYDYENYYNGLNIDSTKSFKKGVKNEKTNQQRDQFSASKRRNKNNEGVEIKEEEHDQICEQCKSGLHGEVMLLCDRCDKGWHIYCLSPPLKHVPTGNWYCFECLNSDKDSFGFVPGKHYTLEAFRRVADRFRKKWFGSGFVSRVQVERKFWEIVDGSLGEVEVMYGSDLDTSQLGSGFPRLHDQRPQSIDSKTWNEYCSSPWNLNNLPKLEGSVLQAVHHNITGVMVPWLYIGMLFSSFCWHFEDHCFYSVNYLHWGEPKCWYSIPGSQAEAFEKVMKSSLPDLFDAQPDLLFQLVTMLNPSVLQENGVPVYSILQEPGNFVVTFPRSYHGGFNLGLNCAEAVNFAPADWLPHGGFGSELYKRYHKTAVLCHEELLCVVAKSACNSRICYYLKKELLRIYTREKTWRGKLWKNGIIQSSCMTPRNCPQYVGTEEDPTCVICHQYLYLSAVVCRCRPSTFVCLEHWEHLCECEPMNLRLLYRHSLSELHDLVLTVDKYISEKIQSGNTAKQFPSCEASALMKKVKGGHVTLATLASKWLHHCSEILQNPFSSDDYTAALREAEQFLWAGPEMDLVRDMVKNLIATQKWAEGIHSCLSRIEKWSLYCGTHLEKVQWDYVTELLILNPVPCNEPAYEQLKTRVEEARMLVQEIRRALSGSSSLPELELLYNRSCELPFYLKESEELSNKISSLKTCLRNVRRCISVEYPNVVDVDVLHELKLEMSKLQLQLPETEVLLNLLLKAESCRSQCGKLMSGAMNMKDVEEVLQEWTSFNVDIAELKLLRQCHSDAVSWLCHFKDILQHAHEREDQQNIINELICILEEGNSLKIKVDELPLVEVELKKAYCREKALRALNGKMSLEFIQQLIRQAEVLHIEREKFFVHWSGVLAVALKWEERAQHVLSHKASIYEFNDVIRASEDISVILPSLGDIMDAISEANSWLNNSKPFLNVPTLPLSSSRKVEELQMLVSQSKLLKICFEERNLLEMVLGNCKEWQEDAHSVLQETNCLLNLDITASEIRNDLASKISDLLSRIESMKSSGMSLDFDFHEMPKLQNAYSTLQWCNKALSFCSICPSLEDALKLVKDAECLSSEYVTTTLLNYLVEGVKWVHYVLEIIPAPWTFRRCKLSDAEELFTNSQRFNVSFSAVIFELENAILKHKLWMEQVHNFLTLSSRDRSWPSILKLSELGNSAAFECSDLQWVKSEVEKIDNWRKCCLANVGVSFEDGYTLTDALQKVKLSLDRSLSIYGMVEEEKGRNLCCRCSHSIVDKKFLACSTCKDCYHLNCHGAIVGDADLATFTCFYCKISSGSPPFQVGIGPLSFGPTRIELDTLQELLANTKHFCIWIDERDTLNQLIEQALSCQSCLREIVVVASANVGNDIDVISQKLTAALKAVDIAGVCNSNDICKLQLVSAKNSWKVRVNRLLDGSQKPSIEQIQMHLIEGQNMQIPHEDYYVLKLVKFKSMALEWTEKANQVAIDFGALNLENVFELIVQGERLPVCVNKELRFLQARSMLHCICRKPYDRKGMTLCDQCDEWYHLDCMGLPFRPDFYICPACKPREGLSLSSQDHERLISGRFVEPRTPSPLHAESRKRQKRDAASLAGKRARYKDHRNVTCPIGMERLWWRNRKPFGRMAKRRLELQSLSPLFCIQK